MPIEKEEDITPVKARTKHGQNQCDNKPTTLVSAKRRSTRDSVLKKVFPEMIRIAPYGRLENCASKIREFFRGELVQKVLAVQVLTTLIILFFVLIQEKLNDACFYPKICACNFFPTRLVLALRQSLGFSLNYLTKGYYCLFMLKEGFNLRGTKIFVLISMMICSFAMYLLLPNNVAGNATDITSGVLWGVGIFFLFFIYTCKLKWPFRKLANKIKMPILFTLAFYLHTRSNWLLRLLKINLSQVHHGQVLYIIIISVFNTALIYAFFLGNRYYTNFIKGEQNILSPQIFYSKYFLCITIANQISIFLLLEFNSTAFWLGLATYLLLVLRLHTSVSIPGDIILLIYSKIKGKPYQTDWKLDSEFYRILGFQHIEVILIYLSRLGTFCLTHRWTYFIYENHNHIRKCNMASQEGFFDNMQNVYILVLADCIVTVFFVGLKRFRNLIKNQMAVEEELSLPVRVLFNLSLHSTFEYYVVFFYDVQS